MDAEIPVHWQNFYLVCGTAIPVIFVAQAIQLGESRVGRTLTIKVSFNAPWPLSVLSSQLSFQIPTQVGDIGLLYMLLGEGASLFALAFNRTGWFLAALAGGGLAVGVLIVVLLVSPAGELINDPQKGSLAEAGSPEE